MHGQIQIWGVSITTPLDFRIHRTGSQNSGNPFTDINWLINDKNEQPDAGVNRVRSGRVLSAEASGPLKHATLK